MSYFRCSGVDSLWGSNVGMGALWNSGKRLGREPWEKLGLSADCYVLYDWHSLKFKIVNNCISRWLQQNHRQWCRFLKLLKENIFKRHKDRTKMFLITLLANLSEKHFYWPPKKEKTKTNRLFLVWIIFTYLSCCCNMGLMYLTKVQPGESSVRWRGNFWVLW